MKQYRVTVSLVMLVVCVIGRGVAASALAIAIFSASVGSAADAVFNDPAGELTFRYPAGWEPVKPQLASTKVLLYAREGSQATCNVSSVPMEFYVFDQTYVERWLKEMPFKDIKIVRIEEGHFGMNKGMVAELTGTMSLPAGSLPIVSQIFATVQNGNRVSIVCNGLADRLTAPTAAFNLIVGTLLFLRR